jgi:outer membrane protein
MSARSFYFVLAAVLIGNAPMIAQTAAAAEADLSGGEGDIRVSVGAGLLFAPAFLGAKTYKLSALPEIRFAYGERFSASIEDGIRFRLAQHDGWAAGPIVRIAFPRNEDDSTPFQLAGPRSNALRGLGDVDATVEAGAFLRKSWDGWRAEMELRRGLNGHQGLVGDLSISHTWLLSSDDHAGRPMLLSLGPRVSFVDTAYNNAYFGINAGQSARSGLAQYHAAGGLLSYGAGAAFIAPLSGDVTLTALAGYTRLGSPAAGSPLIVARGARDMGTLGVFFSYTFGKGRD